MKVLKHIDMLIKELMYRREPISAVVVLGEQAYEKLLRESNTTISVHPKHFAYHHELGTMTLRLSNLVEPYSISINMRTIDDIMAEEILLGEDDEES